MPPSERSQQNVLSVLDREIVQSVMKYCNCSEERAREIIQRSSNDPELAKAHYRRSMSYLTRVLGPLSSAQPQGLQEKPKDPASTTSEIQPPTQNEFGSGSDTNLTEGTIRATSSSISGPQDPLMPRGNGQTEHQNQETHTAEEPGLTGNSVETIPEVRDEEVLEEQYWDFKLPVLTPPDTLNPGAGNGQDGFNLYDLVSAAQHGADLQTIEKYIGYYHKETVQINLNKPVEGFPSIFFAVATNNKLVLRTWVSHGGDVNIVHEKSKLPLLAFAIMRAETCHEDITSMVATLLSLGADPQVIPTAFHSPFLKDIGDNGPDEDLLQDIAEDENKQWCSTASARARLAQAMNLTQRYHLEQASKTKKPSARDKQVGLRKNAEGLLGIPYTLIGETIAAERLSKKLLTHLLGGSKRPLVLVFSGPSGHGKTELARRLGDLMSLEIQVVDCTIVTRELELFGPRHPHTSAGDGSPINNFLARNSGKRCIVFLDEFEKTTKDIHQALLLPFDNGEYQDRRNLKTVDCKQTIWILATNALDATIQSFYKLHHQTLFVDEEVTPKDLLMKQLEKQLKQKFLDKFGAPITGRISAFLPFLPFSPGEQAVVVHKYLLELAQKVSIPVNLSEGPKEQLVGNVQMRIRKDASVCRLLAEQEYHADLGARSLITGVNGIEDRLVESYLDVDEEIEENDRVMDFVVDVIGGEIVTNMTLPKLITE